MTSASRRASPVHYVLVAFGVALLYVACAKLGLALAVRAAEVSAVWPPTGFALAAVVLLGRRAVPGVLLGAFVANAATGEPLWVAAGIAAGNTLEAIAGAAILVRSRFDASLARVRDVMVLLAAVALAPCVSATIGVAFLVAGGLHPASVAPSLWPVWWIGDALGGLIVTPLILVWARDARHAQTHGFLEPAGMLGGIILAASIVFALPPKFPAAYVVYPFLIWAALRLGPAYTTTASLLANAIAVAGTLTGHGPFAGAGPERGLVLVQCYVAVGATTALILAAIAAQSRAAHERADRSEQRLRMAMAGARVGVWEWNIVTGDVVWSEALEPLHGLPQGGFAGTYDAYRKTIHPDDLERVETLIARSVETRTPYEAEFRLLGPDGVLRWTSARAIVIEDAEGRAARMVGVGVDVTHLKQLEEELRLQHRRKDEFLAMLGHELRNPLAAIVHAVELLWSNDPEEVEGARRVIRRQTRNMSRLIDELLDISRISRGQITLERRRLALPEVVSAGVDVWRHLVSQKRQRLTIDAPKSAVCVDGDATRLTQVFANLVHNAAKFTPEGGTIAITVSGNDGSAVVTVRDDGQGMTPDVLAHAFELFVQGPPSLDRQHGGLGLGLTLVCRLVEMHGGSVEAKSAGPGRGSEVVVRLPLPEAEESAAAAPPPVRSDAPARRRRVLVVEDNADARDMLVILLRRAGHDVRAASDGVAAISAAEAFVPEIVLLDVGLPGLDGYGVARKLRSSPRVSDAMLVALTGYGQDEDRERAFAAGFDHHLLKPAEPAAVLELIGRERNAR
ncbi:MAG TPA: MASE1 domain-containing protein [Thermoanaerobaculia bacterium]|nr:MASE1 domain-containing protein [Thermoanaerobaculia bacterium]